MIIDVSNPIFLKPTTKVTKGKRKATQSETNDLLLFTTYLAVFGGHVVQPCQS